MFSRPAHQRFLAADGGAGAGRLGPVSSIAEAGMLLGRRYQLVEPIASGGMAQVWVGQDVSLVRQVAIKILHPHLATDEGFVARFRREAIASAKLSHPSIVAVYDTLSEHGIEAIVMELIDGRTLRAVLNEVRLLPPADVVDVGMQISDALDTAHRAGIVHRDIKPANIMVGSDRRIMVTDFGIAKANKDADLTHTGTLLGTAKYLAPEQVAGEPVDPRADIYALGVVLFEAATGQPPFLAETDAGTALARLQNEVPRCRHRRPEVPVGLDEVIARAMARNPGDRFERASTFRAALAGVNLFDVRFDTSDLGQGRGAAVPYPSGRSDGSGPVPLAPPVAPPGPSAAPPGPSNVPPGPAAVPPGPAAVPPGPAAVPPGPAAVPPAVAVPPYTGTAILPTAPGEAADDGSTKPRRKQRRASKKAAENAARARAGGTGGTGRQRPAKPGRQRPTKLLVASLLVGGLVVTGLLLASIDGPGSSGDPIGDGGVALTTAVPFDPMGDGRERANLAPLAIDGDQTTKWQTETYSRPRLGGLKSGVGLIVGLDQETSVNEVGLLTDSEGWSAEIFVGTDFGPNDGGFDLGQLGDPAGRIEGGGAAERVSIGGATGSQILIWITETGTTIDEDRGEVFRYVLFEVAVS